MIFISSIIVAIILEVIFAFDGSPDTEPLTQLIIEHVNKYVFYTLITGFFVWLIYHFRYWYRKQEGK